MTLKGGEWRWGLCGDQKKVKNERDDKPSRINGPPAISEKHWRPIAEFDYFQAYTVIRMIIWHKI